MQTFSQFPARYYSALLAPLPTILVLLLLTPNLATSADLQLARAEFIRALAIIDKTQLTLFSDTARPPRHSLLSRLDSQIESASLQLQPQQAGYQAALDQITIDSMREVLSETIDSYNDQYASYINPDRLRRYREKRSGKYVGIGLKFRSYSADYPLVIGSIIDGPLDDRDVAPGDKIISAGGYDLKGFSSNKVISILKGPTGTSIKLTLRRGGIDHEVDAIRRTVALHYSRAELLNNNTGYIRISRFGAKTHKRVEKLLLDLLAQGIKGLVLDLRYNPGGSTRAARAIVSMFSSEETIYCEKYKSGKHRALPRHGKLLTDLPLAVLINGESMSSSEIVAGALQDFKRGVLIGSPTYGKGLVQKVQNLSLPLGGAIRTTIAVFSTPEHNHIQGAGIVPDIYLESPADFMFKSTGSLNISSDARAFQRKLLEAKVRDRHPKNARTFIDATDTQLERAIEEINLLSMNPTH